MTPFPVRPITPSPPRGLRSPAPAGLLLASLFLAVSCGEAPRGADDTKTGRVVLALTATGPDGVSYRLPATAQLGVTRVGGGFAGEIPLGGEEASRSVSLPVGAYSSRAHDPADPGDKIRTLLRGTDVVAATLDTSGVPFTVVEGQTTALVLRFDILHVGDVTFQVGTLSITADVHARPISPKSTVLSIGGPFTVVKQMTDLDLGEEDLATLLTALPGAVTEQKMTFSFPTNWIYAVDKICAAGTVAAIVNDQSGLARLFSAFVGGSVEICFFKSPDNRLTVSATDVGDSESIFAFRPDGSPRRYPLNDFKLEISYALSQPVWDGQTLRLSLLAQGLPVTSNQVTLRARSVGHGLELGHKTTFTSAQTLRSEL